MTEKQNAKQFPKMYYVRHMQPGIVGYDNETILVDTDAIKKMLPTAIGMPVYIHHDEGTQQQRLERLEEDAVGYITESFYNELDGWAWFKILATKDEAHEAVNKGWRVSNAYIPTEWGAGGTKNNCPFTRCILNGKFTHLAITPIPRYEGAEVKTPDEFKNYQDLKKRELEELQNSKPTTEGKKMFNFLKSSKEPVDDMIVEKDGVTATLTELFNAKKNSVGDDEMMDVDGEKMTKSELVNRYSKMNAKMNAMEKKNAEDEAAETKKKEDEEKANAEKKNAEDEEKKKKAEEEEKKNAKNFEELKNAHNAPAEPMMIIETSMDKLARGQARYGSQA